MDRTETLRLPAAAWPSTDGPREPEYARTAEERVAHYLKEHSGSVFCVLKSKYRNHPREDLEEVLQDGFLRLYNAIRAGKVIESPPAWVVKVASRLMVDRIRKDKPATAVLCSGADLESQCDPAPTIEAILLDRERKMAIYRAVAGLSDIECQCLRLRYRGLKFREIAAILEIDLRRVAEHVAKAVTYLEQQVRD